MAVLARQGLSGTRLLALSQCSVGHCRPSWTHNVCVRPGTTHRATSFSTTTQCRHSWEPSSSLSLDAFLQKFKPSQAGSDGSVSWIWVCRLEQGQTGFIDLENNYDDNPAVNRGKEILEEYTKKIVAVRRDKTIPAQGDTEKGIRSKADLRNELESEATEKLHQLAQESGLKSGKWLFFLPLNYIDTMFATLARDLVTGDLSKTPAFLTKVSTSPVIAGPKSPHLISLYLPDIYDRVVATEVLRAACKSTGFRPNSAKTDFYSLIGLYRNHPSGIKSTIWSPYDLVPDTELKELTEPYWRSVNARTQKGSGWANSRKGWKAAHKD